MPNKDNAKVLAEERERLVVKLNVLEKAEAILKQEQEKIKQSLLALVGFDTEEKVLPYRPRIVKIDDSSTAYECTDESIPSAI